MPQWLLAGLTGTGAGAALLVGSALAWFLPIPSKVVAGIMAFGAGVLISALAFDLVDEAVSNGGLAATLAGFLTGAVVYVGLNIVLAKLGARHRKRSGEKQPDASSDAGGAIAIGALLDGIPESMVLGLGFLTGGGVSITMLAAVFISNVPEGLSSSAGWKKAGRTPLYVFGVWGGIALISGVASLAGYALLDGAAPGTIAFVNALAAGAILAMISDTMIPEAFQEDSLYSGLLTTLGFLAALSLHHLG